MNGSPGNYSVVILTLNEERNLPRCLGSVADCDDIVVLDSGSTDRTVEIARAAGARVEFRAFDSFAGQRNHAQRGIRFRHAWVFHLDADEQFTPALDAECRAVAARNPDCDGFFVAPKMMFEGAWLPHCTDFPAYQARFVRAPEFRFVDAGHGQREHPAMRMQHLRASYLHDLSAGGETEWRAKHERYAREEAIHAVAAGIPRPSQLWSREPLARRRALKALASRLPARGLARFIYQYFLRGGFLDGPVAFRYCRLLAWYDAAIARETRRRRRKQAGAA